MFPYLPLCAGKLMGWSKTHKRRKISKKREKEAEKVCIRANSLDFRCEQWVNRIAIYNNLTEGG
jgi:hypothetical protein